MNFFCKKKEDKKKKHIFKEEMKKRCEKHENGVTLKWDIPTSSLSTEAQQSNFHKEKIGKRKMGQMKNERKVERKWTQLNSNTNARKQK